MPTTADDLHSRSIAAGYDPAVLQEATVLVVGAGALGQNVALNLALAGVGHLIVVDFDHFEPHNATKSPLYPAEDDRRRWGDGKAVTVAHRVLSHMTAANPTSHYAHAAVQSLGDGIVAAVDAVVSAVDNPRARAWLTERAKVTHTPLFEGGFHTAGFTVGRFDGDPATACYRCINPQLDGAFSCGRYANLAAANNVIPAIQNTAAVTAGYLAEQLIMELLGRSDPDGPTRLFGDLRTFAATPARVVPVAACPGRHFDYQPGPVLSTPPEGDAYTLLGDIARLLVHDASVLLPEETVITMPCTGPTCPNTAAVGAAVSAWAAAPRCSECDGPWPVDPSRSGPHTESWLTFDSPHALLERPLRSLGYGPGSAVEVHGSDGWTQSGTLPGTITDMLRPVVPDTRL